VKIGSLFSGLGGLELGLESAGLGETVWQVEQDALCLEVLKRHWPHAKRFTDVRTVGAAELVPVDLICGGFPCQDVSSAGRGEGLAGERSGLWFEFARIVGELRPQWVVVENVAGGALRWVDAVVSGLEQLGYQALPLPLSAGDLGAPHRRARVFVVAYADGVREFQPQGHVTEQRGRSDNGSRQAGFIAHADGDELRNEQGRSGGSSGRRESEPANALLTGQASHADSERSQTRRSNSRTECTRRAESGGDDSRRFADSGSSGLQGPVTAPRAGPRSLSAERAWSIDAMPEPAICRVDAGLPRGLVRKLQRRRNLELKALGNAVVPQCAEVVGHVIQELIRMRG
jgi:DNA (cytosine-5)-methyltransferase 1